MTTAAIPTIPDLEAERARLLSQCQITLDGVHDRDLTDAEAKAVRSAGERIDRIDVELGRLRADDRRARFAAVVDPSVEFTPSRVGVRSEPSTYGRGAPQSYFADLIRSSRDSDVTAQDRLRRHAAEVAVDAQARVGRGHEEYRDLTRVDGAGGQFVPPLHLVDDYVALARASRPTANIVNRRALPGGTDSLNIPTVTTGTATAIQTADNAAVQETDLADSTIAAPVRTIAGQQDVAVQLLEQSPVNFDEVIFADLLADMATKINVQVLSGSGAAGQVTGIRTVAGTNSIVYNDATPTVPEAYPKLADAIQQIAAGRFLPASHIVMAPRRWAWFTAALDSQNRPLVVPTASNPVNAAGSMSTDNAEGIVGTLMGLPVIVDPSIPLTLGAGSNEDVVLVIRADDIWLWESVIRTRVLPDLGSGTLTTRLQCYSYIAMATRYPKSVSVLSGTFAVPPTF